MDDTHLFAFPAPPPQLKLYPNTTRLFQCTLRVLAWDNNLRERGCSYAAWLGQHRERAIWTRLLACAEMALWGKTTSA